MASVLDLIGAVPVMLNAYVVFCVIIAFFCWSFRWRWLPIDVLEFCIINTDCKVLLLDSERADIIEKSLRKLSQHNKMTGFLVFRTHEGKGSWAGMSSWDEALRKGKYQGVDVKKFIQEESSIHPEDNAAIYFTSGTTGRPSASYIPY